MHTGRLIMCERMANSRNGNPRYRLFVGTETSGFSCVTGVDSQAGYKIPNYVGKPITAWIGTHRGVATLHRFESAEDNQT